MAFPGVSGVSTNAHTKRVSVDAPLRVTATDSEVGCAVSSHLRIVDAGIS